jgi:hypothetical protein
MNLQKLFNRIPINRLVTYLILLGFFPTIFATLHFYLKKNEWNDVLEKVGEIHEISETRVRKQYLNTIVRNTYCEVDQFYIENQLESLCFLKKEKERLEQLFQSPTFTGNEAAEKRYALISANANRFAFTQGNAQIAEGIHETACTLSHPVEVDTNDLKEILNRIEGVRKGKPQLIITDFKLNKKSQVNGNEVYELNLKFKKREFH